MECLWLEVRSNNNKFLLCTCYRPPDGNHVFWDELQYMIDLTYLGKVKNTILTGDFNADPSTANGKRLLSFSDTNAFKLHITEPTRVTEMSSSILDQFISNIPEFIQDTNVDPPLLTNDHRTISITLKFKVSKQRPIERLIWQYKQADFEALNVALQNANWEPCFEQPNVDFACSKWNEIFLNLARQYIPNKVVQIRIDDKPWYNTDLRKLSAQKNKVHRNAKRTNSPADWEKFRRVRNQYTEKIREASSTYRANLASKLNEGVTSTSPKSWWHIARQFMRKTKSNQIPAMKCGDRILTDDIVKAEEFNNAFLQFATIDTSSASLPDIVYKTNSRLASINISQAETLEILKSLDTSKASGPDGISCKMLKETAYSIAPSFTRLLRLSFSTATVPKCWKQANVLPIFKKGDGSDFGNYRPVSLLNICSKVCEKLVFKYLFNFCRDNNVISMHQSGFTPGDSTIHQLVYLYNTFLKALNDKKDVRIVFCDQSKAFDRVWHQGLLYKLECIGITGDLLEWFHSYLDNREQRVIIHGLNSRWGKIPAGVPQGAHLGPLLFLIYINDITENIKSNIKLFADDTSLYVIIDGDAVNATKQLNDDLTQISAWADNWLVKFNASKSKALTISLKKDKDTIELPLTFNNSLLDTVTKHKHLGIEINSNLTWKDHCKTICENASKKLNILATLKTLIDRKTLTTMYTSFVRPGLEYGSIICCNCSGTEDELLESVQRRGFKIITGGIVRTPTIHLYNEVGLETLKARRDRNVLLFFFKIINNMVPDYLRDLKPEKSTSGRYMFRNKDGSLYLPNGYHQSNLLEVFYSI